MAPREREMLRATVFLRKSFWVFSQPCSLPGRPVLTETEVHAERRGREGLSDSWTSSSTSPLPTGAASGLALLCAEPRLLNRQERARKGNHPLRHTARPSTRWARGYHALLPRLFWPWDVCTFTATENTRKQTNTQPTVVMAKKKYQLRRPCAKRRGPGRDGAERECGRSCRRRPPLSSARERAARGLERGLKG